MLWPLLSGAEPVTATDLLYRLTGGSFIASGLIAWRRRPENRVGALMVGVGFAVFIQPLLGQVDSLLVQTIGAMATDYWTLLFVVLLLVFPQGRRLEGRLEHALLFAFSVPLFFLQPVWMLFYEESGFANVLLVWPDEGIAKAIDTTQRAVLLVSTSTLFLLLARRWWKGSVPLRRVLVPVLAGGATMLAFSVLLTVDLITGTRSQDVLLVTLAVLATVPFAFLAGLLRSRLARVAIGELLIQLRETPTPVELKQALARSLRDPALDLLYWLPAYGTWVDADGRATELPDEGGGRATTLVRRGEDRVAALVHDASLADEPELVGATCAAAAIALENAQLHADLQARVEELRASRARIVETGDTERRRLERNLHDGAQQRLVSLSLSLGMAESRVRADPEAAERLLAAAKEELALGLDELRELARGIHPGVLSDHGLPVALESLVARAPVPVELAVALARRPAEPVEVAVYFLVSEALANVAKYAHASKASVRVAEDGGAVVVEVSDDGIGGADDKRGSGIRGLADRVEALGGTLAVFSPPGEGTRISARIPT